MTVIDAQVHVWDAETSEQPWPPGGVALALARYPNVAFKATSLPSYVTDAYPYPSLYAHIHRVVEAYGPHRVFRGTDLTRLHGSYRQAVTLFTEELDFLSDINTTGLWVAVLPNGSAGRCRRHDTLPR
jgi:predicted TIM-barrel fold metal-dependent hydrolase